MKNKIFIKVKPPIFHSRLLIYRQDSQKYTFALSIKRRYDRIVTGSLKKKKDIGDFGKSFLKKGEQTMFMLKRQAKKTHFDKA